MRRFRFLAILLLVIGGWALPNSVAAQASPEQVQYTRFGVAPCPCPAPPLSKSGLSAVD